MADNTIDVAVRIGGDASGGEKAVKSIRQELREAQQEAVNLSRKFGEFSPEALAAAQRVANLKDEMGDLKARVDALNPDAKFKAFSQSLQGVAGGFAGLQGAIGLFGTESAELEKQLLKVQSALALSQGIDSLLEARDSFGTLATLIKGNVTKAFGSLRSAIISTGIGALVVGIGLLIANFETVKKVVLNLVPGLGKVADFIGKLVTKVTDFVGITSEAERASERLNKSTKSRNEEIDRQIKLLQAQGGKESEIAKLQKEKADNQIKNLQAVSKANKGLTEEQKKEYKDLLNEKNVIDAEERKRIRENNEAIAKENAAAAKQRRQELERERQEKLEAQRKEFEEARELFEKNQQELRDANKTAAEQNRLATFDDNQREIEELTTAYNEKLNKAKEFGVNIEAITEEYNRNVKAIQDKTDAENLQKQIDADNKKIAKFENDFENDYAILDAQKELIVSNTAITEEERTKLLEENSKARKEIEKNEFDFKKKQLKETGDLLNNLGDIVGKQTAAGKALGIATALINTYQGASEALKEKSTLPQPLSTIARFAAAGAIIANGLRTVKQIASVKVPGGGGGGGASVPGGGIGGGGVAQAARPPMTATADIQATQAVGTSNVNVQNQSTVKAFVVEKDITDSQDRVAKIKAAATI